MYSMQELEWKMGVSGGVTYQDTAPTIPHKNDFWFDTANVELLYQYNDGVSTQWVVVVFAGGNFGNDFIKVDGSLFTTDYTLEPGDYNRLIRFDNTTDVSCVVPFDLVANNGWQTLIFRQNTGEVTIRPAGGVTLLAANNELNLRARYSLANVLKLSANTFIVGGDLG